MVAQLFVHQQSHGSLNAQELIGSSYTTAGYIPSSLTSIVSRKRIIGVIKFLSLSARLSVRRMRDLGSLFIIYYVSIHLLMRYSSI